MNLLKRTRIHILSSRAIHALGALLLLAGAAGGLIQTGPLRVGEISNEQLYQNMQADPAVMALATAALICQLLESCAVPVFAFLLTEGAARTGHFGRYFLRVVCLAAVCQLLWEEGLNPVFGPVLGLLMLWFFRKFPDKRPGHRIIRAFAVAGTLLWSILLGVAHGPVFLLLTAVQWGLRRKTWFRTFGGSMAALACGLFSPLYLVSPLSFLILYFYDEDRGGGNKLVSYAAYPLILLLGRLLAVAAA